MLTCNNAMHVYAQHSKKNHYFSLPNNRREVLAFTDERSSPEILSPKLPLALWSPGAQKGQ